MIYCVEDEKNIRELLVYTLETTGFTARGMADGKELKAALKEEIPNLILLDIMLPGDDGYTILEKLKSSSDTRNIPVIMVTAKEAEYDKVRGLEGGADDYITKPFGMMEFVARVKAVLRRCSRQEEDRELVCGELKLSIGKHRVAFRRKLAIILSEHRFVHNHPERLHQIAAQIELIELAFVRQSELRIETQSRDFPVERRQQNGISIVQRPVQKGFVSSFKAQSEQCVEVYLCRVSFTVGSVIQFGTVDITFQKFALRAAKFGKKFHLLFYFHTYNRRPHRAFVFFFPIELPPQNSAAIMSSVKRQQL